MKVCVCVSCGLPPDLHRPSPQNLAWAPHFPKCWPPGVPPTLTLPEKPWRVKNGAGASKQKLLFGVGLPLKILFVEGSPKPGALQGPPYEMGVYALRIGRGPANKSCSSGWVCLVKFYLWGAHLNTKPAGSLDQSAWDYFSMKLFNSPGQRRLAHACSSIN